MSQSLERALDLLNKLADGPKRLGPLTEGMEIHKSTVLRLLQTLERRGFVRREGDPPEFTLGFRLVELSQSLLERLDIRQVAASPLKCLGEQTGETVHLAVLDGAEVVYLDKVESVHPVRMYSRVGARAPAYCTGVGKVLLAFAPRQVQDHVLANLTRITPYTIVTPSVLSGQLQHIRREAVATTSEEMSLGGCSLAVPVVQASDGAVAAAIGVVVPSLKRDRQRLLGALQVAARGIGRAL